VEKSKGQPQTQFPISRVRTRQLELSLHTIATVLALKSRNHPAGPNAHCMKNRLILALLVTFVISLLGCYAGVRLYPVHGPAATQGHSGLFKASGVFNSGNFWGDLNDPSPFHSESCKGKWETTAPPKPPVETGTPGINDMAAVWDAVYGADYYVTHVMNAKRCAPGSCMSKRGTVLDAEVCELGSDKNGKMMRRGVAKDNKSSIYRFDF
jgi:hypothetical protein